MSSSAPREVAAPDVAALVKQFFRHRGEGRRVSVDEVLAEAGAERDGRTRSALIDSISRQARRSSFHNTQSHEPAADPAAVAIAAAPPEVPGYDLIEEIGRGGMGAVYEAYQQSTGRRVAVKLIAQYIAGNESARRRFEREVELVARLQHPNIVSVLDSGIHQGRYFYVMEYVDGVTLDRWSAECPPRHGESSTRRGNSMRSAEYRPKAAIRAILELVAKICDAVEYAHQRGVLHRDLKPGNILVICDDRGSKGLRDQGTKGLERTDSHPSVPQPKILDFGLAKDIDPLAVERRALTLAEPGQIMGTLAYMAPEQARGAHEDVSVRSDVYSLGAIAYEALIGRLPCPTDGALHDVLDRIQRQDPSRPSSLDRGIPADVDAMLLKALDKAPERRYGTAGELANDLRRWLNDEPVAARPASAFYQFRKFSRRNKALVGGVAATVLALAAGLIASLVLYLQAESARAQTEKVAGFQGSMLSTLDPEQVGRTIRDVQRRAVEAGLRRGWVEGDDGHQGRMIEEKVAAVLERFDDALAPANPTDVAREVMDTSVLKPALAAIERDFGAQPEVEARLRDTIGLIYRTLGLYERAESELRRALDIRRRLHPGDHLDLAISVNNLAVVLYDRAGAAEAETLYREALTMRRRLLGNEHVDVAGSLHNLAALLRARGDFASAEPLCREALAIYRKLGRERGVAMSLHNLAALLCDNGDFAAAIPLCREALALDRKRLGDEHEEVATSLNNLAAALSYQGDFAAAEPYYLQALAMRRKLLGDEHPELGRTLWYLGEAQRAQGKLDEAEKTYHEALVLYRKLTGEESPDVADVLHVLGRVRLARGDWSEAERWLSDAVAMRRKVLGEAHRDTRASVSALADVYDAWHAAEPDKGHEAKAAEWRAKLAEWQTSTQPALNDNP